jgi:hypothetical protein
MLFTNDFIEIQPTYDLENIHSKYAFGNILKGFFHLQKNLHIYQLPTFTILNISKE